MESSRPPPHVVMFPLPNAQGHINPMMQLANRMAARGILVTILTIEYSIARLKQANEKNKSAHHHQSVRLIGVPDGLPADSDRHVVSAEFIGMLNRIHIQMEVQLKKLLEEGPITCIIADIMVSAANLLANKFNIPRYSFWPQSATVLTIHTLLDTIRSNGSYDPCEHEVPPFPPFSAKDAGEDNMVTCIPGISKLHPRYLPYYVGMGDIGLKALTAWANSTIQCLDESIGIIGNTFKELEPVSCQFIPNLFDVGPLLPSVFLNDSNQEIYPTQEGSGTSFLEEEVEDCMTWLHKQPNSSVVYVSFGSLTRLSIYQIQQIARGLMASNQRFLWVIRKDTILEKMDVSKALPEDFLEVTKNQGKIVHWAPQLAVLSHVAVGGFFSHCGWNSLLESVTMGVPILAWPQISDQVTNCWMLVHEWKFGLELVRDSHNNPTSNDVEQALRTLMEGEVAKEMLTRVTVLRDKSKEAVSKSYGSSNKSFCRFVDGVYNMALK